MVVTIRETRRFSDWLGGLRDGVARARITARIRRLVLGNPGDAQPAGDGISELRVRHGPGYRAYFLRRDVEIVVLLCGGDKSTQGRDIAAAKALARQLEE